MRILLQVLFIAIALPCFSQTLEEKIRDSYCECLTDTYAQETPNVECFKSISAKFKTEIEQYAINKAEEDNVVDQANLAVLGMDLITSVVANSQQYFFKNCGNYYKTIDESRNIGISSNFPECEPGQIKKLTGYISEYEFNSSFIFDRGRCYVQKKQYDLALKDFNASIEEVPDDYAALFCKAWTLEKLKKYSEASQIYSKLYTLSKDEMQKISFEITKYKANN